MTDFQFVLIMRVLLAILYHITHPEDKDISEYNHIRSIISEWRE